MINKDGLASQRWNVVREDVCRLQLPIPTLRSPQEVEADKFLSKKEERRGPPGSTLREPGEPLDLLLTNCSNDEFTCHEGSCIPLRNLCDNVPDCPMMPGPPWATYDEMRGVRSCETKVRVDVRQHGPPTFKPDLIIEHDKEGALQRVPVTVNVSMLDFEVKEVKEVEHKFFAKFKLVLEWFERRIIWHNLKEEETLNHLSEDHFEKLFVPILLFKNTKTLDRTKVDNESQLFGRRKGLSQKPDDHEPLETALFSGSQNPLVYSRSYFMEFTQDFDLKFYPFDKQLVRVEIGTTQSVIKLMPKLIDYVGTINSHRFTVQSWSIEQMIKGESLKGHVVVVKVLLKRRITQVTTLELLSCPSSFIPTLVSN